jgi:hypothetical protein
MFENQVRSYYENAPLEVPGCWNLSRKHVRIVLQNGSYAKLNRYRHRLNQKSIKSLCAKYAPVHVYFSVLDWLFPERVGKKTKANHAIPVGGEYVCDIDSSNLIVPHNHRIDRNVCLDCLYVSKDITLYTLDEIEKNYRKIQIVFSGRRGFHIHVQDFDYRDWTYCNERDLIKSHEVARYKYTMHLSSMKHGFNRAHFVLSTDPMRIISLPYSLNAVGELVCITIGDRRDLEKLNIGGLTTLASPYPYINAHPEPYESTSKQELSEIRVMTQTS